MEQQSSSEISSVNDTRRPTSYIHNRTCETLPFNTRQISLECVTIEIKT